MFVLTSDNQLINLQYAKSIYIEGNSVYANMTDGTYEVLAGKCRDKGVAYRHLGNIADALAKEKAVYVIGVHPGERIHPSDYLASD